jgi:NADH-quinone oxidoreductase subunit F
VVSISGGVRRPGNYEVELGVKLRDLIWDLAGGPLEGREVKAFYPGGSSSPVLTPEELDLPYSFEAMAEAGSMLGSGSIIVADDTVSIPHMALRTARFYHHESCGKCTPCREGTNWTVKMLERVVRGEATPMDLDIISSVQQNIIGHCLCVLGDSMAMPVSAMVNKFRDEFEEVIARAAAEGLPDAIGRESQVAGEEPGPGGVGPEVIRRQRLMGRPVPGASKGGSGDA